MEKKTSKFEELFSNMESDDKIAEKLGIDLGGIDTPESTFKKNYPDAEMLVYTEEPVSVAVEHTFCPKCGEELISQGPPMYNPFTTEKICKVDCKCGYKANLKHSYPRIILKNEKGEEVNAWTD